MAIVKRRRPHAKHTRRTPEIEDEILDRIAAGEPLAKIAKDEHIPQYNTIYRWTIDGTDFAQRYARARQQSADALADSMGEIEEDVISGRLDQAAAKTVLWSRQWRAGKYNPKRYGDRQIIQGDGDADPVQIKATAELDAEIASLMAKLGSVIP